jgi:hypothetical protein
VHLSASGAELWRGGGFNQPKSVSANPADGSCWVADTNNNQVVHLGLRTSFVDVSYRHWAIREVEACYAAGIVAGYPDGTYGPTIPVSRDQMAVYMSRALSGGDAYVPTGPATATFNDVPTDHWAFKYVEYVQSRGVVQGYADGTYGPTIPLDRGQMAVFIARALAGGESNVPAGPATPHFPDVATDFWAYKHVEYIADPTRAIVYGYDDGNYHPEYVCTRDQMAVFVARAFGLTM